MQGGGKKQKNLNSIKIQAYQTKISVFSGSDFREVHRGAYDFYLEIKKKSKRRAYVRSVYFEKEKIFIDIFWHHLFGKENWRDRVRRVKYFACAIELIQKSHFKPISKNNPNKNSEILHRFYGLSFNGKLFCVQIKEDKRKKQKFLISVFPTNVLPDFKFAK